jgi:hypothetical protein
MAHILRTENIMQAEADVKFSEHHNICGSWDVPVDSALKRHCM